MQINFYSFREIKETLIFWSALSMSYAIAARTAHLAYKSFTGSDIVKENQVGFMAIVGAAMTSYILFDFSMFVWSRFNLDDASADMIPLSSYRWMRIPFT